jgi:signal transduction histidine kinase
MRGIPEDLQQEMTDAFLRNFQRVLVWTLGLQCVVAIPLFAARKVWAFVLIALLLALILILPHRLLRQRRVRSAGWLLAGFGLALSGGLAVVSGGIRSPVLFSQLSLIVAATLILGLRRTLLLAIPLMALDLGLAIYQFSGGQLPLIFPMPPVLSWFILLAAVVMGVSNVRLAMTWLGETLGERRQMFERLRKLTSHQEDVREEERHSVAREIHEDLGQQLIGVRLCAAGLARELETADPQAGRAEALAQVARLSRLVDDAIKTVRGIASELRPAVLDILGLKFALEGLAREFQSGSELPCALDLDAVQADEATAIAIFRVVQEALTNVRKHAQATRVWITLKQDGGAITLTVRDDGRGLQPEDLAKTSGFGLAGMREKATAREGTFEISTGPEGGTVLRFQLPGGVADRSRAAGQG